jgi:hypothetical protein
MGEDAMTDPGQLDEPAEDSSEPAQEAHALPEDTRQQPAGRLSVPRSKRAWLGIALSLIALVGVSAALIAVAIGGGTHQATSGGTSAATGGASTASGGIKAPQVNQAPSSSSKASTAKAKVPSAAQVAESGGAISLPASMDSRVVRWQFGPGGTHLAAVSSLFGTALQQRGLRQYPLMKQTCTQLARSVPTAQAGPPIPIAAMQTLYVQALTELAKGAADCQAAITVTPDGDESVQLHVNAGLLDQSVSELAAGSRDIFRSTAEIEIASRQAH